MREDPDEPQNHRPQRPEPRANLPPIADPVLYRAIEEGVRLHAAAPADARTAMLGLVDDADLRARIGEAARDHVREHRDRRGRAVREHRDRRGRAVRGAPRPPLSSSASPATAAAAPQWAAVFEQAREVRRAACPARPPWHP